MLREHTGPAHHATKPAELREVCAVAPLQPDAQARGDGPSERDFSLENVKRVPVSAMTPGGRA
jgi:hypothetical protein